MSAPPSPVRPDPSSFYRLNEEIARELQRLAASGQLDRLQELLGDAKVELLVSSARPREGLEELLGVLRPGRDEDPAGWDHEAYMQARSQFAIVLPDGSPAEVYMPDSICPACWNDEGNTIDSCARVCADCGFAW